MRKLETNYLPLPLPFPSLSFFLSLQHLTSLSASSNFQGCWKAEKGGCLKLVVWWVERVSCKYLINTLCQHQPRCGHLLSCSTETDGVKCLTKRDNACSCDAVCGGGAGKMARRQLSGTWDQVCLSARQSVTACNQLL